MDTLAAALAGSLYWRKVHANRAVAAARRAGTLPAPSKCCLCDTVQNAGGKKVVYHHHSYAPEHWLTVDEVCSAHHMLIHSGAVPEPRTGRFRRGVHGLTGPEMTDLIRQALPALLGRRPRALDLRGYRLFSAARSRAKREGLIARSGHGVYRLTDAGRVFAEAA